MPALPYMRILLGFWLVRPVLPHKIFRCAILAEAWSSHIHSMQTHLANAVTTASVAFPGYNHLPCIYIWWRCSEGAGGIWTILFDCVESVKLHLNVYRYGCIYVPPRWSVGYTYGDGLYWNLNRSKCWSCDWAVQTPYSQILGLCLKCLGLWNEGWRLPRTTRPIRQSKCPSESGGQDECACADRWHVYG